MKPSDERPIDFDFTQTLPTGVTVVGATLSAVNLKSGLAANSILVSTTGAVSSPIVTGKYAGNAYSGESYRVTATATFSDGTVWGASRLLSIRN